MTSFPYSLKTWVPLSVGASLYTQLGSTSPLPGIFVQADNNRADAEFILALSMKTGYFRVTLQKSFTIILNLRKKVQK